MPNTVMISPALMMIEPRSFRSISLYILFALSLCTRTVLGGAIGAISAEVMAEAAMNHLVTTPNLSYGDALIYSSAVGKMGGAIMALGLNQDVNAGIYSAVNAVDYNFMATMRQSVDPEAYTLEEEDDEAVMKDSGVGRFRRGYVNFLKGIGEDIHFDEFTNWLNADSHLDQQPSPLMQDIARYEKLMGPNITVQQKAMIHDLLIERHLESGSSTFFNRSAKGKVRATLAATGMMFESLIAAPAIGIVAGMHLFDASAGNIRATERVFDDFSGLISVSGLLKNIATGSAKAIASGTKKAVSKAVVNLPRRTTPAKLYRVRRGGGLYDPHAIRSHLEIKYPGQVKSTTVPPLNAPNVKLAGQRHSSGIVLNRKGLPIFDHVAIIDTRIPREISIMKNPDAHMRAATRNLRAEIESGRISANKFTERQLGDIKAGEGKIPGYTWHHHEDIGRMQLLQKNIHEAAPHIGGNSLWLGK